MDLEFEYEPGRGILQTMELNGVPQNGPRVPMGIFYFLENQPPEVGMTLVISNSIKGLELLRMHLVAGKNLHTMLYKHEEYSKKKKDGTPEQCDKYFVLVIRDDKGMKISEHHLTIHEDSVREKVLVMVRKLAEKGTIDQVAEVYKRDGKPIDAADILI